MSEQPWLGQQNPDKEQQPKFCRDSQNWDSKIEKNRIIIQKCWDSQNRDNKIEKKWDYNTKMLGQPKSGQQN